MADALYLILTLSVFTADRIGKRNSRKYYSEGQKRTFGKGHAAVTLQHVCNYGAIFHYLDHHRVLVKTVSAALTAALTVLYLVTLGHAGKGLLKTGLSFLLGGAFSNTYDRLHDGYVTDYLSFHFGPERFRRVVFNIGDFGIILGAFLSALGS